MQFSQDDFDRLLLFEHARKTAEATYTRDPLDADVRIFYIFNIYLYTHISISISISVYISLT